MGKHRSGRQGGSAEMRPGGDRSARNPSKSPKKGQSSPPSQSQVQSEEPLETPAEPPERLLDKLGKFWTSTPVWGVVSVLLALALSPISVKFIYALIWAVLSVEVARVKFIESRRLRYFGNALYSLALAAALVLTWPYLPKPKSEPNLDQKLAKFGNQLAVRLVAQLSLAGRTESGSGSLPDLATDLPQVGFQDDSDEVGAVFGSNYGGIHIANLEKIHGAMFPVYVDGFAPVAFAWDKGHVSYSVKFWSPSQQSPIEVKDGRFTVRGPLLDRNYTKSAFEVVTEDGQPVLQIVWETPSRMRLNGLFPLPDGKLLCMSNNFPVELPTEDFGQCRITPLFKYPSWRYPGALRD